MSFPQGSGCPDVGMRPEHCATAKPKIRKSQNQNQDGKLASKNRARLQRSNSTDDADCKMRGGCRARDGARGTVAWRGPGSHKRGSGFLLQGRSDKGAISGRVLNRWAPIPRPSPRIPCRTGMGAVAGCLQQTLRDMAGRAVRNL